MNSKSVICVTFKKAEATGHLELAARLRQRIIAIMRYAVHNALIDQNMPDLLSQILRTHRFSARLNNAELQLLNTKRGDKSQGEWLCMASLQKLPTLVPPVNIDTSKTPMG